ncbi:MAG: phosphoserine aminotransferase [Phenylobacterium sp.]|jgi:phosphoserine aminotransferase
MAYGEVIWHNKLKPVNRNIITLCAKILHVSHRGKQMNEFYPEIEPYQHFLLDVGDGHQLYVEQCGNPQGQAVVFILG